MPSARTAIEDIVSQLPGYEPRPQQVRMAETITEALNTKRHVLIEAGTGSGKSFGYLIPLIESGETAVVATGTIALQEQLLNKDLPFLQQAFGREIKVAIAKGRNNYLCMHKLDEAASQVSLGDADRPIVDQLLQIAGTPQWNGDRAELPFNVPHVFWRDRLASDSEDCLGPKCPNFAHTPHRLARQACEQAQIIIANHALYLTDIVNEIGLLPKHDVVVFDEAHHLEQAAVRALSVQINHWMFNKFMQRAQQRFRNLPSDLFASLTLADMDVTQYLFTKGRGQFRMEPDDSFSESALTVSEKLRDLAGWIEQLDAEQMTLAVEGTPEQVKSRAEVMRDQMRAVAEDMASRWRHFAELSFNGEQANWMTIDPTKEAYDLTSAPLDVGNRLNEVLWEKRTTVLCSATLAVDNRFDFVRKELGLPNNTYDLVLGSPFDFKKQALLYVPTQLPEPSEATFLETAADEIERILEMSQGRALVLCTSYRSLRELHGRLLTRLRFPIRTQEDLPRARLLEWFRTTEGAVLFATATFWEGVDIPGEALSCVIIDKLPFANPDDPVVQARTERMKTRGEDWFNGFVLPKAVLTLKQGFGRLIRTKTDTGIVAILDRRLLTKRYGSTVLRSLPPARRLHQLADDLASALAAPGPSAPSRSEDDYGYDEPAYLDHSRYAPPPDLDTVLNRL